MAFDPSHHQFNSDRSQLTILSVSRADDGEYVCTANSNIAADNATIVLDVFGWFYVTTSSQLFASEQSLL